MFGGRWCCEEAFGLAGIVCGRARAVGAHAGGAVALGRSAVLWALIVLLLVRGAADVLAESRRAARRPVGAHGGGVAG